MAFCCAQLSLALSGLVFYPYSDKYNATEASYWSLQEASLTPACVVRPSTAQDVVQAISVIAAVRDCDFAIKSQGHAPAAGFANVEGGVTIDLVDLKAVALSEDKSTVSVDAGASWLDVYQYLAQYDLAAAGGRNGQVGVGGLLLGGGISHFSPRVGWACDGVVNFEVVLASGHITNANATSNPDLFRALKGGGSNFALVTRFDLATFPQGNISATTLINDVSQRRAVFNAFTAIANATSFDVYTSLVTALVWSPTSRSWEVFSSAVYTEPVLHPAVFDQLATVPSISNSSEITNYAVFADEAPVAQVNQLFATGTYRVSVDLMLEMFDILNETASTFDAEAGVSWSLTFEPLPTVFLLNAEKNGGDVLGMSLEDGNKFVILLNSDWTDSSISATVRAKAKESLDKMNARAAARGLLHRFQYMNYAAPFQSPITSYGQPNLDFLKSVSEKFDPSGVFQRKLKGGFKLP